MDFLLSADTQEKIAFLVVGSVALFAGASVFRAVFARGVAQAFLKRGWVSLAMRVRGLEKQSGCGACGPTDCGTKKSPGSRPA